MTDDQIEEHFKQGRFRTVERLPPSVRWAWKEVLDATEKAAADPMHSDIACLALQYLPSMLLFPMNRGGTGGWRKWNARFRRFWSGEWESLLSESATFSPRGRDQFAPAARGDISAQSEPSPDDIKQKAAHRLVSQGELSRAAQRLIADKVATPNQATLDSLRRLHPPAEPPSKPDVGRNEHFEALSIDTEYLIAALKTAPRGSAPGPTGWRYEHLRAFLGEASSDPEAVPCPTFVRRMLFGDLPDICRRIQASARLFALEKSDGGVRPIAIGDVLRRWITKALCMQHKVAFQEDLSPLQFAVGTEAGSEKIFRAAQTFIETEGGPFNRRVLISLDCRNAFNSVDRQTMLDELGMKYPAMVDFFWQFYGQPALLWFRMDDGSVETILSEQGTQQGDAAGPFLFCLAFQPALLQLQQEFPDAFLAAFMDDVIGGIDESQIAPFTDAADRIFLTHMLSLRRDKSCAWSPQWLQSSDIPPEATNAITCSTEGIKVVGGPIGSDTYVNGRLNKVLGKHRRLLDALVPFAEQYLQDAALLLRYCAVPRMSYYCRLLPPAASTILRAAAQHDFAVLTAAGLMYDIGQPHPPVIRQLRLPIRLGGLGLTSAAEVAPAAFLGSVAVSANEVLERFADRPWMPAGGAAAFLSLPWLTTAADVHNAISNRLNLNQNDLPPLPTLIQGDTVSTLQKTLTDKIHKATFEACFDSFPDTTRARPRILSCHGPAASGWLTAIPSTARKQLSNHEYRLAVLLRLGLNLPQALQSRRCVCNGNVDSFGDHFFLCHRGNQRSMKHNALRDLFRRLLAEVNIPADTEVHLHSLGITPPSSDPNQQRMDLYFILDGEGYLADVTVTHSCRPDPHVPYQAGVNRRNATRPGGEAAREAEKTKENRYKANVTNAGFKFIPLAAETFGRWGEQAADLLKLIAKKKRPPPGAGPRGAFTDGLVNHWNQCLSVALMKYNAQQISSRAHHAARSRAPQFADDFAEDLISRGPYRPHTRPFMPF